MPLRLPSSLRSESTIRKRSGSSLPDPWATSDYSKPLPPTPDLSPIPLTPRPEASRQDSEASIATRISQIPRLPTPNFLYDPGLDIDLTKYYGANRTKNLSRRFTVRSTLSRGISYISVALRPTTGNRPTPLPSRPISTGIRTESDTTLCSTRSILSSLSTAEKFTKKWPKPQPLKKLEKKSGLSIPGTTMRKAVLLALEDGQGLGMDRVQQWTNFKWCLVVSIFILFCYGTFALGWVVSTWFRAWDYADVMYVADYDILVLMTLSAWIIIFTSLVGWTGTFLNSRPILATYALLLWPALVSILAVGYTSYRRASLSLDLKLNFSWSQYYTPFGRLLIQNSLGCCGYYTPLHEATLSNRCYPRTPLPGCKGPLFRFEQENLGMVWSAAFSIVPLHLINILVSLLCSNHVTQTFGKGLTPKQYRLTGADVRADAEKIALELERMKVRRVRRPVVLRASTTLREDRASVL